MGHLPCRQHMNTIIVRMKVDARNDDNSKKKKQRLKVQGGKKRGRGVKNMACVRSRMDVRKMRVRRMMNVRDKVSNTMLKDVNAQSRHDEEKENRITKKKKLNPTVRMIV